MKMNLALYSLLVFLLSRLSAQETVSLPIEEAIVVNSGEAQYDGKEIVLVGQVAVQHSLGQIAAHRLSLLPSMNKGKKSKLGFLNISEDVHIDLKDGGELYCQQAEVDYAKMQAVFLGNREHPDVIYLKRAEEQEEDGKARLELRSLDMTCELIREAESPTLSAKTFIKHITANKNIRVNYNQEYLLLADHAIYQRLPDETTPKAGLLTLTVKDNLSACMMTNLNGDRLLAHMIRLNTIDRKIWLDQPEGKLYFRNEKNPDQILEFSSQELIWDDQADSLLMKGAVDITQNQTLRMTTSREILISQMRVDGKKTVRFLRSPQDTQIYYSDIQKELGHKIHCPGPFVIDNERLEMTMQLSRDLTLSQEENKQVFIEDILGDMYADFVHIYYSWNEKHLVAEKMILQGNVRLVNRYAGPSGDSGVILHYALADSVEYFPKLNEMMLKGENDNRVLFIDKTNNVQMSAPSLKLKHDPITKKDAIQGLGDVRFTFIEKELEQLKNRFSFTKELQDEKSTKR